MYCLCVGLCTCVVPGPRRSEKGVRFPWKWSSGIGVTDGSQPPCGCWELYPSPLQKQSALSTARPSLEPHLSLFLTCAFFAFDLCVCHLCSDGLRGQRHQIPWGWNYKPLTWVLGNKLKSLRRAAHFSPTFKIIIAQARCGGTHL